MRGRRGEEEEDSHYRPFFRCSAGSPVVFLASSSSLASISFRCFLLLFVPCCITFLATHHLAAAQTLLEGQEKKRLEQRKGEKRLVRRATPTFAKLLPLHQPSPPRWPTSC